MSTSNSRSTAIYDVSDKNASVHKEVQALKQTINLQTHSVCSEAPTILITNYSHNNGTVNGSKKSHRTETNLNSTGSSSSSITIYTHNSDSECPASLPAPSINILINNHFDRPLVEDVSTTSKNDGMLAPLTAIKIEKSENDADGKSAAIGTVSDAGTSNGWASKRFSVDSDVLVKRDDARIYLGTIVEVGKTKCLVKYDDNSVRWTDFEHVTNLITFEDDAKPVCVLCKNSANAEALVNTCGACYRAYHDQCMSGKVSKNGDWHCGRCTSDTSKIAKNNAISEKPKHPKLGNSTGNQLPYDVSIKMCSLPEFEFNFNVLRISWT